MNNQNIAILGAGPAGLTAAYMLAKNGNYTVDVFEKDPNYVGGISRTETYKGYQFDIGGHRFFSKSKEVEDLWTEILGDELLERPRSSRIFYDRQFFSYPLVAGEALRKLGIWESLLCVISYLKAKLFPVRNPENFEQWVTNQFGRRLYHIFFKTYTEKVWGIPCHQISADWAAQRIKGLSLSSAIFNALFPPRRGQAGEAVIKTLIDTFRYPKNGPGQMWQTCRQRCEHLGVRIHMDCAITSLERADNTGKWLLRNHTGRVFDGYDYVISSAPLREVVWSINNPLPSFVLEAAGNLQYRDFITVVLILKERNQFADNWIYIHDPAVRVGRVQNFKSWSPYMVPDAEMACYGLEYFCFEGDGLWTSTNAELEQMAVGEMEAIGLCQAQDLIDSYVVRQPKAYPVYDRQYLDQVEQIKQGLQALPGLILVGRNGMHKYNNQDHSMMTAMLAVRNIIAGKPVYDLWKVNQDAEYHEEGDRLANSGGRMVPLAVNQ
jgi:protoporphyrinogen oxidase